MANIVNITLDDVVLPRIGGDDSATVSGTVTVDYDNLSVIGSLTATIGSTTLIFSNFTFEALPLFPSDFIYTVVANSGNDQFSMLYGDQAPATVDPQLTFFPDSVSVFYGSTNVPVTSAVVCFVAGTHILTERGEVPVERLHVGDRVVTASGRIAPVRWLGHRTLVDLRRHPNQAAAQPVRIAKDAFGPGRPSRDLLLSPGHSVCVDLLGEVLIPAGSLVNGATVSQCDLDSVVYWHVELDAHDIVVADGLPCESYLDCGNRSFFSAGEGEVDPARADPAPAEYCRPAIGAGPIVDAVRLRLTAHAKALGWTKTNDMDIHLVCDGQRIDPLMEGDRARFLLPAGARDVELRSGWFQPIWDGGPDARRLGLAVRAVRIFDGLSVDRRIEPRDERLCDGFHEAEGVAGSAWRWTNGRARLPAELWSDCVGEFFIVVEHDARGNYRWRAPQAGAETELSETDNVVPLQHRAV
jgi:hypothetical protein